MCTWTLLQACRLGRASSHVTHKAADPPAFVNSRRPRPRDKSSGGSTSTNPSWQFTASSMPSILRQLTWSNGVRNSIAIFPPFCFCRSRGGNPGVAGRGRAGTAREVLWRGRQDEEDQAAHRRRPLPQPPARFVVFEGVVVVISSLLLLLALPVGVRVNRAPLFSPPPLPPV